MKNIILNTFMEEKLSQKAKEIISDAIKKSEKLPEEILEKIKEVFDTFVFEKEERIDIYLPAITSNDKITDALDAIEDNEEFIRGAKILNRSIKSFSQSFTVQEAADILNNNGVSKFYCIEHSNHKFIIKNSGDKDFYLQFEIILDEPVLIEYDFSNISPAVIFSFLKDVSVFGSYSIERSLKMFWLKEDKKLLKHLKSIENIFIVRNDDMKKFPYGVSLYKSFEESYSKATPMFEKILVKEYGNRLEATDSSFSKDIKKVNSNYEIVKGYNK